jgi:hypothetical protein
MERERDGNKTHRCGPLPAAGAGPAYCVTATPSSVLTFNEEPEPAAEKEKVVTS